MPTTNERIATIARVNRTSFEIWRAGSDYQARVYVRGNLAFSLAVEVGELQAFAEAVEAEFGDAEHAPQKWPVS